MSEPFSPAPVRFRVWDGERMHHPDDDTGGALPGLHVYPDGFMDRTGCLPLLSTGLRDADGVEVFDGDLWAPGDGSPPEVVERGHNGWAPFDGYSESAGGHEHESTDGRVVGNVYEGVREPA